MKNKRNSSKSMADSCSCECHGTCATISGILVVIGALNWGLLGLGWLLGKSNWNLVSWIFGSWPMLEAVIYVLVGLAGVAMLIGLSKGCK